ncbi:MAG: adenosylcobinamide amidohydrolase [Pseudomonadota bacterium]
MLLKKCQDWVEIHREEKIIIVRMLEPCTSISTCRLGGGFRDDLTIACNHQCCEPRDHLDFMDSTIIDDPEAYHNSICDYYDLPANRTAILETAANMNNAAIETVTFRDLEVTAICTGGVECNSMAAGDPASVYETKGCFEVLNDQDSHRAGTINLMLFMNQTLTMAALVDCVMTATEAKAAVLRELGIYSRYSDSMATGTGTDQILVASRSESGLALSSGGKHTKLGELVGRVSLNALRETLIWQNSLSPNVQCSCLTHLGPLCADDKAFCEGVGRFLRPEQAALFTKNLASIDLDPPTVAALDALIHVRDKCLWGVLPSACVKEMIVAQGAMVAAAVSGKFRELPTFVQKLSLEDVSIDAKGFTDFVYRSFALGFDAKWRK